MKISKVELLIFAVALVALSFTLGYFFREGDSALPYVVETELDSPKPTASNADGTKENGEIPPVNINTADIGALMVLPSIGETTAGRIVAFREENGPFRIIEEIMDVSGIGQGTFDKIKDYIKVE